MTIESLRCFCAVAETGSFRRAAGRVFRSQPAVSQQIKALERQLGYAVVNRRTGRLTAQGEEFYSRASAIVRSFNALERDMADRGPAGAGEFRLGASDTTAVHFLPPHVRRFTERMPRTRLVITTRSSDAIAAQVLRGELDLGLVTLPQNHPELEEAVLFRQLLVPVVPAGHPLAAAGEVGWPDLAGLPMLLIDRRTRTGAALREHFEKVGFSPQVVLDSGSFEVVKRYLAEGAGVSFLPEGILTPSDTGLRALEMPDLPEIVIGALWRRDTPLSRAAGVFLETLRDAAPGQRG